MSSTRSPKAARGRSRSAGLFAALTVVAAMAVAWTLQLGSSATVETASRLDRPAAAEPARQPPPADESLAAPSTTGSVTPRAQASPTPRSEPPGAKGPLANGTLAIRGVLTFPSGFQPTHPAEIYAWPAHAKTLAETIRVEAAPDGTFEFTGLAPSHYKLAAHARHRTRVASGRTKELNARNGRDRNDVTIALTEYAVRGVVTNRQGKPLQGIGVRFHWHSKDGLMGKRRRELISLDEALKRARWERDAMEEGQVVKAFRGPTDRLIERSTSQAAGPAEKAAFHRAGSSSEWVVPAFPKPSPAQDVTKVVLGTAEMRFTLAETTRTSRGQDAPPVRPSAARPSSSSQRSRARKAGTTRTDANGAFVFPLEGPGRVVLDVQGERQIVDLNVITYAPARRSAAVDRSQPVARLDVVLQQVATLTGQLRCPDGSADGIHVKLTSPVLSVTHKSITNATGQIGFYGLPPGSYTLLAQRSGKGEGSPAVSLRMDLELGGGADIQLDELLTKSSSLTGHVVDRSGTPKAKAKVVAVDPSAPHMKRSVKTDASGRFAFEGVYAGDYQLFVKGSTVNASIRVSVAPGGAHLDVGTLIDER